MLTMTGLRAYWVMLPLYHFCGIVGLRALFFCDNSGIAGEMIAYLVTLYLTHSTIASGKSKPSSKVEKGQRAPNSMSLRFMGLVLLVVGAPLLRHRSRRLRARSVDVPHLVSWGIRYGAALDRPWYFGVSIPRFIWNDSATQFLFPSTKSRRGFDLLHFYGLPFGTWRHLLLSYYSTSERTVS